jgi:hypothetical protein
MGTLASVRRFARVAANDCTFHENPVRSALIRRLQVGCPVDVVMVQNAAGDLASALRDVTTAARMILDQPRRENNPVDLSLDVGPMVSSVIHHYCSKG